VGAPHVVAAGGEGGHKTRPQLQRGRSDLSRPSSLVFSFAKVERFVLTFSRT
jgi:hypothetical protein